MISDNRLLTINQMILALLTLVAVLAFLFVLVLVPTANLNQTVVTIITSILSVLTTVVVMQQTHFFKSGPTLGVPNVQNPIVATSPAPAPGPVIPSP
jgi:ABC-type branched-subunit amino acid transport system permease subunit